MSGNEETRIDPAVVAALYLDYADDLRAFLIGILRDGELAAETLQATFTKAMESGHTANKKTLKGWLFRVAFNEAMAIRRRQKVHEKSLRQLAWQGTKPTDCPEENLSRGETVHKIRAALEILPAEQQAVVRMRIYEEKTFAVIAEELGAPLGTVLTRMRLAMRKLQREIEKHGSFE